MKILIYMLMFLILPSYVQSTVSTRLLNKKNVIKKQMVLFRKLF